MYRKIMEYFKEWKKSPYRKPLILQGARQVGKTYSVLEFGREHYENIAYFNFETNPQLIKTFVMKIYRAEQPKKPLENYRDIDSFKVYVSDVGLLCAKKDIVPEDVLFLSDELNEFKGGMVENYVCCQLTANGYINYYWTSDRSAEVDFIIQRKGSIIPIEVKSADNTKSKSLGIYIRTYKPEYAVKLSTKNFGFEDGKKTEKRRSRCTLLFVYDMKNLSKATEKCRDTRCILAIAYTDKREWMSTCH